MLEGYFKHFATNFRNFPKISEDMLRLPMTSDDFRRFHKKLKMLEHFATISGFFRRFLIFFRRFPKTSADFRRFSKIFKKVVGMFSKEFQQRRHEPLLPVTDRPLNFFMYVINK